MVIWNGRRWGNHALKEGGNGRCQRGRVDRLQKPTIRQADFTLKHYHNASHGLFHTWSLHVNIRSAPLMHFLVRCNFSTCRYCYFQENSEFSVANATQTTSRLRNMRRPDAMSSTLLYHLLLSFCLKSPSRIFGHIVTTTMLCRAVLLILILTPSGQASSPQTLLPGQTQEPGPAPDLHQKQLEQSSSEQHRPASKTERRP